MGVASLVLALINLVSIGLMNAVAATAGATFHSNTVEKTPFNYLIGTWIFAIIVMGLAGIVFAIGGLRQRDRKHSFAMAGLWINIAIPIGTMFYMMLLMSVHPPAGSYAIPDAPAQTADEPPAWRTPAATVFQSLTIGMGSAAAWYFWNKRRVPQTATPALNGDFIICHTCRKQLPRTSNFCRRCGAAMQQRATSAI